MFRMRNISLTGGKPFTQIRPDRVVSEDAVEICAALAV
jgi:hypothetical protein